MRALPRRRCSQRSRAMSLPELLNSRVPRAATGRGEAAARGVPLQFLSPSTGRSFLVRAEVRTPVGGSFAREAIVELAAGEMDELREWRRGQGRFDKHFSAAVRSPDVAQRWPPC